MNLNGLDRAHLDPMTPLGYSEESVLRDTAEKEKERIWNPCLCKEKELRDDVSRKDTQSD